MRIAIVFICILALLPIVRADDAKPLTPIKPIARLLPPQGVEITKEEREKLEARLGTLVKAIDGAKVSENLKRDVQIYTKAVRWALDFDEFYDAKKDVAKAHAALDSAQKRLDELKQGKSSWTTQRGLVVRGYRSRIDGSVQPYGLHIPEKLDLTKPVPLLVWLHGRGDKETDLHFIASREKNKGEFAPDWCITLHPYGRGTIGFKFAGERDVFDSIGYGVEGQYRIDRDRIALAGFSMGGAGAWHIGARFPEYFCVVHAGAGFVETAKYNKLTPDKYPAWFEQKLWGFYDVPNYTRNLFNVPVIAYSGENDKQIQAAREMEAAFKAEGRILNHIVGPGVEHKYEPKAKEEILKQIKAAVDKGRDEMPNEVFIQGRHPGNCRTHWLIVASVREDWSEVRAEAKREKKDRIVVKTTNVASLIIREIWNRDDINPVAVRIVIDGQEIAMPPNELNVRRNSAHLHWVSGKWSMEEPREKRFRKYNNQFGPIDDAFMNEFTVVLPSKQHSNPRIQRWLDFEIDHFRTRWRATFRGEVRIMKDVDVAANHVSGNLILWGDPSNNVEIARMLKVIGPDAPITSWTADQFVMGNHRFDARTHIPILIFPRPRLEGSYGGYIVLNSGPTFREGHDRTNSQQTPKLPDWAIIGLDKDPDAFAPGEIKAAGFFDENWKVKAEEKK